MDHIQKLFFCAISEKHSQLETAQSISMHEMLDGEKGKSRYKMASFKEVVNQELSHGGPYKL